MCRSGSRAAKAVNAMADAGYTNAYVIVDSFEGDKVSDPASYYDGKRMKNGWKNSGAPWGYKNDPRLVYPPVERESK
jgi:rhodanese-related sulfurtransferase